MKHPAPVVVVPNWNGIESLHDCLSSLEQQTLKPYIVVVDNGSVDGSVELIRSSFPNVVLLTESKNHGFAGGVNIGIKHAVEIEAEYVALFNNDAVADEHWLHELINVMDASNEMGITTCKLVNSERVYLDTTGEYYSSWGLPFSRGRGEVVSAEYDNQTIIFGASGGASLYRVRMLQEIGLFDEDFFAYYEDVDLSFRAQLAGWKVMYAPTAVAYHQIGATSGKLKGFTTYQTMKNLPWVAWKNVPGRLLPKVIPRLTLSYLGFFVSAVLRGHGWYALKGATVSVVLFPKKLGERFKIQRGRKVSTQYIASILIWDLPPKADNLRKLRAKWWRLLGKN